MKKIILSMVCCFIIHSVQSQLIKTTYPEDKAGTFIVENQLVKHAGLDYPALVKSATAAAEWFQRNNPLVHKPKGFNTNVSLFGNSLPESSEINNPGYGERFSINFSFRYFYVEGGVEKTATGWAAYNLDIRFNQPLHELARPLSDRPWEAADDPGLKQALNQAHDQLQQFYTLKPLEKSLAPGVQLFAGGQLLVSNPERPSLWIPATVGEVTQAILDYYKIRKSNDEYKLKKSLEKLPENLKKLYSDGAQVSVYDLVEKDFAGILPGDRNKPAFLENGEGIYKVNATGNGLAVVKYNSECWNKSQPRTSVQYVSMKYTWTSDQELEAFRKRNNQLKDYVGLFLNALPVEKIGELIHP